MHGAKAPYRPHTSGRPASLAYDRPCGTTMAATDKPAARSACTTNAPTHVEQRFGVSIQCLVDIVSRARRRHAWPACSQSLLDRLLQDGAKTEVHRPGEARRTISHDFTLYFGSQPRIGRTATAQSIADRLVYLLCALHGEHQVDEIGDSHRRSYINMQEECCEHHCAQQPQRANSCVVRTWRSTWR